MINGIKKSQVHDLTLRKIGHERNLQAILQRTSSAPKTTFSVIKVMRKSQSMHQKRRKFEQKQHKKQLHEQNYRLTQNLIKIASRKNPVYKTQKISSGHWCYFINSQKQKAEIEKANNLIAQKIQNKQTKFDHNKDLIQYRKHQQIAKRICKFQEIKKMEKNIEKSRLKTQNGFTKSLVKSKIKKAVTEHVRENNFLDNSKSIDDQIQCMEQELIDEVPLL